MEHEQMRVNLTTFLQNAKHEWHGVKLGQPDWSDGSHAIALSAEIQKQQLKFHFILNAFWEPLEFELPPLESGLRWSRWIDTALDSPEDIVPWESALPLNLDRYRADARSVVVFFAASASSSQMTR